LVRAEVAVSGEDLDSSASVTELDLWNLVQGLDLPLVLTRLSNFTIEAATPAYFEQIGIPPAEVLGHSLLSLFDPPEQPRAEEALQAIADGTIDFYRTYRPLSRARTTQPGVYIWSHALEFDGGRYVMSEVVSTDDPTQSPLGRLLGFVPGRVAVGLIDANGTVVSVSNEVMSIIGISARYLIGRSLMRDPQRAIWLRMIADQGPDAAFSVSFAYRPEESPSNEAPVRCLILGLANTNLYCFILTREPTPIVQELLSRTAELEQRLLRIAQEVQASGILASIANIPDLMKFPQLAELTPRQWEVLNQLLRGQRVAAIATNLFLSQNTVRNILSSIFRQFGVHSQSELLELLRP
jgi:DNA-binding CsgD family transcriptional regulator